MKLVLGTAQFGLDYGVSNRLGRIPFDQARQMIADAQRLGIDTIDTAIAYGDCETRLGEIGIAGWRVITKLPGLPGGIDDVVSWVQTEVAYSLARLRVNRLQGLLLHRPMELISHAGGALYSTLVDLRERGIVEQIGISVYGPEELEILAENFRFDLVQAPLNILDRRMVESGWLQKLSQDGTEVHVRSVFLQGLLLMDPAERPPIFQRWNALWQTWHAWLAETGISPLAACLRFAASQPGVSRIVIGADNAAQLAEIASAYSGSMPQLPESLRCYDPDLLLPFNWRL